MHYLSLFQHLIVAAIFLDRSWAKTAEEWRELSIYQVITDRFALTDGSTPDCFIRDYCGGTWKGIENKLDYIQGMGFDAIWISPVIHNIEENTTSGQSFHGFWADDPFRLNDHFGTPEDLTSLSNALHDRNMSLMVDVVINHFAANANAAEVDFSQFPSPFDTSSAFHSVCNTDMANQTSKENCWLVTDPPPALPDINSENQQVFGALVDTVVDLVQTYNIDGIRLDTAQFVPRPQLAQFQDAVGVFVTGETFNGSLPFVAQYQGPLDSILNFPLLFPLRDTLLGRTTFDYLAWMIKDEDAVFDDVTVLGNFVDNHDLPRFASFPGADEMRDQNAATLLFLGPGIPIIYYGFEQRFSGAEDPVNREGLWNSNYRTDATLYQFISKISQIRQLAADINGRDIYFASRVDVLNTGPTSMAFQKGPVVVVLANSGYSTNPPFEVQGSQFSDGSQIVDLLSCDVVNVSGSSFSSPANTGQPRIWISSSQAGQFC